MKLSKRGNVISKIEVLNISVHGIWLMVGDKEFFLSYRDFPWFQDVKISDIQNVQFLHDRHLYWPQLNVDLELESLHCPQNYPLIYS